MDKAVHIYHGNFVGGSVNKEIQYDSMPIASSTNLGQIVQYVGTTTATYTNGYFYKCTEVSGIYGWTRVNVQPYNEPGVIPVDPIDTEGLNIWIET